MARGRRVSKQNLKTPRATLTRKPRLLWANPYCMMDTSSGASISVRQILIQLQRAGYEVDIVGATIFDNPRGIERMFGIWTNIQSDPAEIVTVNDGTLVHRLVKTKQLFRDQMAVKESDLLYQLYTSRLDTFRPDVVFFYGGQSADFHISAEARARGIPSMAYLVNSNYVSSRWCRDVDLIVTDTQATSDFYAKRVGFRPVPVGKFIDPADVIATKHQRRHVTLINPSWAKGGGIVAMLALLLEGKRSDITFEVVESRGSWKEVVRAVTKQITGQARDELSNVIITPNTSRMADIYERSRVVLGLSQWWESGSRVLAEAMLNGIPAIVSNSGGSPEMVGDGGIVVDLPPECHEPPFTTLPKPDRLKPMVQLIERLWDDEVFYLHLMTKALRQGFAMHRIGHSTERLITAMKPLVDQRAGDNDPFMTLKAAHKHGLSEKSIAAQSAVTSTCADSAPVCLPQIVVVTEGLAGSATFVFSTPLALLNGEPTAAISGGIDSPERMTWLCEATGQRPVLVFASYVQTVPLQHATNNVSVHKLSELPEIIAGATPQLKVADRALLQNLVKRLRAFSQGKWEIGDDRPVNTEKGLSVGFVLFGNYHCASSRLQGQYVAEWLNQSPPHRATVLYRPSVRYEPELPPKLLAPVAWAAVLAGCNTVIFQKTDGKNHLALMQLLSDLGMMTVFVDCDVRSNYAHLQSIDHVIVTVDALAARYRAKGFSALSVIPDTIDFRRTLTVRAAPAQPIRGVWIGTSDKFPYFDRLRSEVAAIMPEVKIDAISDHPASEIKWQPELFPKVFANYDFGFVTLSDASWSEGKSPNRAILMMANGLPTLAEHRPAYESVIEHGQTGFLFQTAQDAVQALEVLQDEVLWSRIAAAGAEAARMGFSMSVVGPQWMSALTEAMAAKLQRRSVVNCAPQSQVSAPVFVAAEMKA